MVEKLLHVTRDYAKGSSMQKKLLKRLQSHGILEADDMPLAFDMTPSHQGEVPSNLGIVPSTHWLLPSLIVHLTLL
jgi:hypothetical protein